MRKTTFLSLVILATLGSGQDQALSLSGSTAYVVVPASSSLVPTGGITVEAWFNAASYASYSTLVRKGPVPANTSYNLRLDNGAATWIIQNSSPAVLYTGAAVPPGNWHHLAGTYDDVTLRVYLDGALVGTLPAGGPIGDFGSELRIGRGADGPGEQWNGLIDAVRVWSYARSAAEIQSTMHVQLQSSPGLVSSWNFDGNLQDSAGTHHGTLVGSVTGAPSTTPFGNAITVPAVAPIGSALVYNLLMNAGAFYVFDVSMNGTFPGINFNGVAIPLNQTYLNLAYGAAYPGVFVNFTGSASGAGTASAILNVPALPWLIGTNFSATFVTLDYLTPSGIRAVALPKTTLITGFAPLITGVLPSSGPAAGGTGVLVSGGNFQPGATVMFGNTFATNVIVTPSSITCTSPPGAVGPIDVHVENPDTLSASLSNGFTYVPTLVLNQVSPLAAPAGATITVTGSGIQQGVSVSVGVAPAQVLTVGSSSLTFALPASIACDTTVTILNPDGQVAQLPFNPSPHISGLSNATGPAAGGSSFVVIGNTFLPGTSVTVGGQPATIVSQSTSFLFCVAPPGSVGPATLGVTSAGGCSASSTFVYQ